MTNVESLSERLESKDIDKREETRSESNQTLIGVLPDLIDQKDVTQVIGSQKNMLSRFEKTNQMLVNCNALAVIRFDAFSRDIKRHTQQLTDIQKDLDSVFHRIKFLKLKLNQQYPKAFEVCGNIHNVFDEEEEDKQITEDLKHTKISENIS